MAQQVKIANVTYNDVPSIFCPDANGVLHQFTDTSITTATANDVLSGKQFVNSAGNIVSGLLTPGLEYETGTWQPTQNTTREFISFAESHTHPPTFLMLIDVTGTDDTTQNTAYGLSICNFYTYKNAIPSNSSTSRRLATATVVYRTTGIPTQTTLAITALNGTTSTYLSYWITTSGFYAYSASTTISWRSNRTYKWVAVWVEG